MYKLVRVENCVRIKDISPTSSTVILNKKSNKFCCDSYIRLLPFGVVAV
jgi:hypothetical protein